MIEEAVYFAGVYQFTHPEAQIKPGWAKKRKGMTLAAAIQERLDDHATDAASAIKRHVELLAAVRGTYPDEQQVHRYFRQRDGLHHHGDEWFYPREPLLGYIRYLRDCSFAATSLAQVDALPARQYDEWCPLPERVKDRPGRSLLFWAEPQSWLEAMGVPELTPDDFYTAPDVVEAARAVMGGIDLDPASCPQANRTVRATRYFTRDDDGLTQAWSVDGRPARVFLNPPFSAWRLFAPKICEELDAGRIEQMCVYFGFNGTTRLAELWGRCARIVIPTYRWQHWGAINDYASPFRSGIMYFGSRGDRFVEEFSRFGQCFTPSVTARDDVETIQQPPRSAALNGDARAVAVESSVLAPSSQRQVFFDF